MKRSRKSNRVSWAHGVNLCQVKFFLSEDCPLKVGQKYQDPLQAKTSWMLHSNTSESSDLPPGFEGNHLLNKSKEHLSLITRIKWKCPPLIVLSPKWHVAAGEQSEDHNAQKLREFRVLEAVYPRVSSIPSSPSVSLDVERVRYDDSLTPVVPIIPIEEEECADMKPDVVATADIPVTVQSRASTQDISSSATPTSSKTSTPLTLTPLASGKLLLGESPGLGVDVIAAAAAVATVMKSSEPGSMIDTDLLIKILRDPKMVENLTNNHVLASTSDSGPMTGVFPSRLKPATQTVPMPKPTPNIHIPSNPKLAEKLTNDHGLAATYAGAPISTVGVPTSGLKPAPEIHMPSHSKIIEKLTNDHRYAATSDSTSINAVSLPSFGLKLTTPSVHMSKPTLECHVPASRNMHHLPNVVRPTLRTQPPQQDTVQAFGFKQVAPMSCVEPRMVSLPLANRTLHGVANKVRPAVSTIPNQPNVGTSFPVKDANYYKNLVRQHGADTQEFQDLQIGIRRSNFQDMKLVHNIKAGEVNLKFQKPCMYFKSSRGCRNGSNCPYQHDMSVQLEAGSILRTQNSKRLKL
ncbi:zinc finger CCCH domain-containing protein 6-like [Quillaja saponaria]|uniref:Zinc finger CCCH domain-containing protein 6-like n=1 Tax=Quillaja saponaria TaxID=32244 RepID=A0AAD7L7M6_QUISA|nr:zinc finger CCCH domain-containing protein 6-like [Quillaja saponaria]KAJ7953105.1 zinc finger CCCH domain-containing protein 6-like [Quillaja saponaria]